MASTSAVRRSLRRFVLAGVTVMIAGLVAGCGTDPVEDVAACTGLGAVKPVETSSVGALRPADIVFVSAQRGEEFEPTTVLVIQRDGTVFVQRNADLVRLAISESDTRRVADCVGSATFSELANAYNYEAVPDRDPEFGRPGTMIARGPVAGDEKVVFVLSDCQDSDFACFHKVPQPVRSLIELEDALYMAAKSGGTVIGPLPRSSELGVGFPSL